MTILMMRRAVIFAYFAFLSFLYLHHATRAVYGGDTGDLTTAACVWGVAHPPGYPLFTVLGGILCHLPIPLPPITKVTLVSIISSLVGLYFFFRFCEKVTNNFYMALITVSSLAFSFYFWLNTEIPEVFALNACLTILIIYFAHDFYTRRKEKSLYLTAFFAGLAVGHHHIIIFVFMGVALLFLKYWRFFINHWQTTLKAAVLFLMGTGIYIYVPIAASFNPPVNWDNATNLTNFLHLFLRKDYSTIPQLTTYTTPFFYKMIVVRHYFQSLVYTLSFTLVFLVLLGIINLFKNNKLVLLSLSLMFFLSGPFFIFWLTPMALSSIYINIVERFYLASIVIVFFFLPYGWVEFMSLLKAMHVRPALRTLVMVSLLLLPIFLLISNYRKTDLSRVNLGNAVAEDLLREVPKDAILSLSGDNYIFSVWYLHYVLGLRHDLIIQSPLGTGGFSNYINDYINTYYRKHPNEKPDQVARNATLQLMTEKPYYSANDAMPVGYDFGRLVKIPRGLSYQLIKEEDIPSKEQFLKDIEKALARQNVPLLTSDYPANSNYIVAEVPMLYGYSLVNIGNFLITRYEDSRTALPFYNRAITINNAYADAYAGKGIALFTGYKDCKGAIDNLQRAIELLPMKDKFYLQLITVYGRCKVSDSRLSNLVKTYELLFKQKVK